MMAKYVDVTSLLIGARNNEKIALQQFATKFAKGRFFVPLVTTKNVRNSPQSVEEMGTELPAHYLSLADGRRGAVFFTDRVGTRQAEKELSWKTDGRSLRCLSVSGKVMAGHAEALFDEGTIDRVILNPGGPNETHLSQGDLAALEKGQPPSCLSFHTGEIPVASFMPPTLVSSLADVAFSKADSFLKQITQHLETISNQATVSLEGSQATLLGSSGGPSPLASAPAVVLGGGNEKLDAVVNLLFTVFSNLPPDESAPGLLVSVNKTGEDIQISTNRKVPDDLLNEAHQALKQILAGPGSFQLNLDLSMLQVLGGGGMGAPPSAWTPPVSKKQVPKVSSGEVPKKVAPPQKAKASAGAKRSPRRLDYIPLEPESTDKTGE